MLSHRREWPAARVGPGQDRGPGSERGREGGGGRPGPPRLGGDLRRGPGAPCLAASALCAPVLAIAQQVRPQGAVAPLAGLGLLCDLKCLISSGVCRPRPPAPSTGDRCGHSPGAEGALVGLCGKKGRENRNMRQYAWPYREAS